MAKTYDKKMQKETIKYLVDQIKTSEHKNAIVQVEINNEDKKLNEKWILKKVRQQTGQNDLVINFIAKPTETALEVSKYHQIQ